VSDDIEKRLKSLEKRARIDAERWQAVEGDIKGIVFVIDSIGASVAAGSKPILQTILKNLKTFEDVARSQNEHEFTMKRIRASRKFFEGRLKLVEGRS
jgi:hypothetical protein